MKERIYSIPLTDALSEKCGCILCTLEKKLEEDAAHYFLGPSLMEPDGRETTNRLGFCRRHIKMLDEGGNRLGLALVLETHLAELLKKLDYKEKKGVFSSKIDLDSAVDETYTLARSCALCEKLDSQMEIAAANLVYLWSFEPDFRNAFDASDALCLEHMALVLSACSKELSGNRRDEFIKSLYELQRKKIEDIENDVHSFTLSFDYRNTEKPSEKVSGSVNEAIKRISKF